MRVQCTIAVIEKDGRETDDVLVVKNYVRRPPYEERDAEVCRRGLVFIAVGGAEYLIDAKDVMDAMKNAGIDTGAL